MEKNLEVSTPTSCLNKAAPDEPVFVLRAKDKIAPMAVRLWAVLADYLEAHESEKITEACDLADQMDTWRKKSIAIDPQQF